MPVVDARRRAAPEMHAMDIISCAGSLGSLQAVGDGSILEPVLVLILLLLMLVMLMLVLLLAGWQITVGGGGGCWH